MEKKPFIEIETKRLRLKKKQRTFQHAQEVSALILKNKEFLSKWMPWALAPNTPEDCFDSICRHLKKWDDQTTADYQIYNMQNIFMGSISLKDINYDVGVGEIGYWLGEEFNGNGYMHEALIALENEFFGRSMERIEIRCDTLNTASRHIAEKAGYVLEGILRRNAWDSLHKERRDDAVFSKLRSEWQRS